MSSSSLDLFKLAAEHNVTGFYHPMVTADGYTSVARIASNLDSNSKLICSVELYNDLGTQIASNILTFDIATNVVAASPATNVVAAPASPAPATPSVDDDARINLMKTLFNKKGLTFTDDVMAKYYTWSKDKTYPNRYIKMCEFIKENYKKAEEAKPDVEEPDATKFRGYGYMKIVFNKKGIELTDDIVQLYTVWSKDKTFPGVAVGINTFADAYSYLSKDF